MSGEGIAILVLVGTNLLALAIMGTWVWIRGRAVAEEKAARCFLTQEVERLERAAELGDETARVEVLTHEDALAELLDIPDLDDGAG